MDALFDSLVFTLGLFLGVFTTEADPAIALRAYRDAQAVYAAADLSGAAGPGFRRLVDAGEPIGVELTAKLASGSLERQRRWTRTIRRDALTGTYVVRRGEDGKEFATPMREAALELLFTFRDLPIALAEELEGEVELTAVAVLYFPEDGIDADSAALWNYKKPAAKLAFAAFKELPY